MQALCCIVAVTINVPSTDNIHNVQVGEGVSCALYEPIFSEQIQMKFYDCLPAPSPRRVRMFIAEKGLDIPVVEVDLANKEQHSASFQQVNPHRTVPVLELDDGSILDTSNAIQHYLEAAYPDPPLIGRNPAERGVVVNLDWRIENEGFLAVGEAFRNYAKSFANHALPGKHEYAQIPELIERGKRRTGHFFSWLDEVLEGREYVAGDYFSVADITAFVTVEFSQWIKQTPDESLTNLKRWHAAVSARDSAGK